MCYLTIQRYSLIGPKGETTTATALASPEIG